jgi:hypothetical protein
MYSNYFVHNVHKNFTDNKWNFTLMFYKLTLIYTHVSALEESVFLLLQAAEGCESGMPRCLPIKEARK